MTYKILIDRLSSPQEWGYRDPVDGKFIDDDSPCDAAAVIIIQTEEIERLTKERDEARLEANKSKGRVKWAQVHECYQIYEKLLTQDESEFSAMAMALQTALGLELGE